MGHPLLSQNTRGRCCVLRFALQRLEIEKYMGAYVKALKSSAFKEKMDESANNINGYINDLKLALQEGTFCGGRGAWGW